MFILKNYSQALDLITELTPELDEMQRSRGIGACDYEAWLNDEFAYLQQLETELGEDNLKCLYLEALQQLWKAE
jgi:hypothetical protein